MFKTHTMLSITGFIFLLLSVDIVFCGTCPKADDIYPCTCDATSIRCSNTANLYNIFGVIASQHPKNVWTNFELNSLSIKSINASTFHGIKFTNIKLDACEHLDCISPQAFAGMEDTTQTFTAIRTNLSLLSDNCNVFSALSAFNKLTRINITNSNIKTIPDRAFEGIWQQTTLNTIELGAANGFSGGEITRVQGFVFNKLKALHYIGLSGHLIDTVDANAFAFPDGTKDKITINLETNKLNPKTFGVNAFLMNGRQIALKLGHNKDLKVLDQSVFQPIVANRYPVFNINNENTIDLSGSPLELRPENAWLVGPSEAGLNLKEKITHALDTEGQNIWIRATEDFTPTTLAPNTTTLTTNTTTPTTTPTPTT